MNIFYSWQADTPDPIGKAFIRLALNDAVSELSENMDLDEAERPNVDQDTQGVMGSPAIAETIFEKIRNSDVVVVDVTLVGVTPSGKKLINSNVAYELGFAHGHHSDEVLLTVMNTYYGYQDDLPFDLKHRRWPLRYELAPDATKARRREVRQTLAKEFSNILKLYLENQPPKNKYKPKPSQANAAMYWDEGEILIRRKTINDESEAVLELGYSKDQPLIYLHIWPDKPLEDLPGKFLGDYTKSTLAPLLERALPSSCERNRYGAITYSGNNAGHLISSTQIFENREIWGIEAFSLRHNTDSEFDCVHTAAFEAGLIKSLNTYLKRALEQFNYPDHVHVEAGMVNVKNYMLSMPSNYMVRFLGPIFQDISVYGVVDKKEPDSANTILLNIFNAVFDAAGTERPNNLHNFPAGYQA